MSRFKKGDRVRLTRDNMGFGKTGDAGEIVNPDAGCEDALVRFDSKINGDHEWFAPWSSLELVPVAVARQPQLTIQPGKFYITRDGRKVGQMRRWSDETKHRWEADDDDLPYIWADDGTEIDSDIDDSADLVAEWTEPQSTKEILDELEAWIAEQDAIKAAGNGSTDYGSTAGFTVPLFDEDDFDICGHRDSDGDIVQLSVGELTAALADSLKVARKVGKTIKRGDLVILARPALVTGVHRYHASVQTDGGNYSLPLAALTAA